MPELSRGANTALPAGSLDLAVSGARQGAVDLMVFQLGPDRKVRSDADFVFFNQPTSPEGAVRLVAGDRISADLTRLPPTVETLAVAVALDDSVPGSLAAISGLAVTVTAAGSGVSSNPQPGWDVQAPAVGLTAERAAVLVEIYRRQGAWKIRNVSAGWAAGLPSLAREHGVDVDEAPPAAATPGPTAAPAAPAAGLPSPYLPSPAHAPERVPGGRDGPGADSGPGRGGRRRSRSTSRSVRQLAAAGRHPPPVRQSAGPSANRWLDAAGWLLAGSLTVSFAGIPHVVPGSLAG